MILIPIGHEQESVRRLPWISFGIIGICLVALIATGGVSSSRHYDELEQRLAQAMDYYLLHPYLELDPRVAELSGLETNNVRVGTLMDALGQVGEAPDPASRREEQARLDALGAAAVEAYESHPLVGFGFVPSEFSVIALVTHMFLHAGWLHLIGNMLILYLAGPYVEDVWGRPLFAGFYLASGLAAALLFAALHHGSDVPMVGASGAIAGVMGAFLVRYWTTRIRFFYALSVLVRGTFDAPAWMMLPLWFGQQLFLAGLTAGESDSGGVAYGAHIGGFVFGAGVAWIIREQRIEERFIHPAVEQKTTTTVVSKPLLEQALHLTAAGRCDRAYALLRQEVARHPGDGDAVLALWSTCLTWGCPQRAGEAMLRLVQHEVRAGRDELALAHWNELTRYLPELPAPVAIYVKLASASHRLDRKDEAAALSRRALLEGSRQLGPSRLLEIARIGAEVDPRLVRGAVALAQRHRDLDDATREQLLALEAEAAEPEWAKVSL